MAARDSNAAPQEVIELTVDYANHGSFSALLSAAGMYLAQGRTQKAEDVAMQVVKKGYYGGYTTMGIIKSSNPDESYAWMRLSRDGMLLTPSLQYTQKFKDLERKNNKKKSDVIYNSLKAKYPIKPTYS